jgi:tetratricopeptide (TPR) repeat protein
LILISLLLLAANQTAQAEWCASYRNGSSNCYFKTQAQCQAAVSGVGGFCSGTDSQSAARRPAAVDSERSPRSERSARSERPVRNSRTKPAREEATKETRRPPPPSPAVARTEKTPAFAVGDDEHIIPAEPEDGQPTLASISETNVTPSVPAGERSSGFIAARDLVLRGNYQAGLAALQNLNPSGDPDVAAYTGFAYSKLGRPADAKGWYQKALALDPNHLWALSYYGLLMLEEGNLRAARENLDKIRTICGGVGCYAYASLQAAIANKR